MNEERKNEEYQRLHLSGRENQSAPQGNGNMARPMPAQENKQTIQPLTLEEWREIQQVPQKADTKSERIRSRRGKKPRYHGRKRVSPYSVSCLLLILVFIVGAIGLYIFAPGNANVLVLGLDRSLEEDGWLSRSDTIILSNLKMTNAEMNMLSIPRDLWVSIPEYGENRINTAHYFGEVYVPGSGPASAIATIEADFGVPVDHYVRIKLEEFPRLIDAMGGMTFVLEEPMGGLPAGTHDLTGDQALAFVRDRAGTDDFFRMAQAQFFIKSFVNQFKRPGTWLRLPKIASVAKSMVDTDIPFWQWGRYGITLLRAYPEKVNAQTLPRTMVNPYITDQGANVLLPDWNQILPLVQEMFRKPTIFETLLGSTN